MRSYYLSPADWREPFVLRGAEAHHLLGVMRANPGAKFRLFDGQGREGVFLLQRHNRNEAILELESTSTRQPDKPEIHLALGWNKAARRGWMLEKAVELNAASLVFWQAARSQGRVPERPKNSWHEHCVAAAKQCGNPWLPRLETAPGGAGEIIHRFARCACHAVLWEKQGPIRMFDPPALLQEDGETLLVLGPEGGLTDDEMDLFTSAGFTALSLGRRILRWETAALLSLGLLSWHREKKAGCDG